jgi:hypothetical protein
VKEWRLQHPKATFREIEAAARFIGHFRKVPVSEATVRRATEKSGEACVKVQTAQLAVLDQELPPAPEGPALQKSGMGKDG